ncbi:MAG TPA: MlaD family protein [Thermoanaerobaculia bacterium]|nr:MlaD family protein [Thermoanaerobaculia bacterium]
MTENDERTEPVPAEETPRARLHVAEWSPWVWILPAAALLFVGFLVIRYGVFGGGDITVRFAEARGLERYSPVRYKGAKVGTVQKITIDDELEEVVVGITMDASMNHALKKGTRFWIVEPGLEGGGLGSLIAGTYVAISPGGGEDADEFRGQEYAPILKAPEAGKIFILRTDRLGSLSAGAPVQFDGIRAGRVLGAEYDESIGGIRVHVFIVQRFAGRVRESTRFYRSGGLNISLAGGGVSMGDASLASLLTGGLAFYTPSILAGEPAAEGTHFELFESRALAIAAADGPHLTYLTYFPGAMAGLTPGTRVEMKGIQVGRVRDVRLRFIEANATLETPVTLEIDPRLLEIAIPPGSTRVDLRQRMNGALDALVRKGMRAKLATSLVLPGASAVSLDIVAKPNTASLIMTQDPPIIPAAGAGRGIEGTLESLNRIAARIESIPIEQISGDLRSAAQRVNAIVQDPAIDQSIRRLNTSLAEVERASKTIGANIDPIVQSLRNAATSAETAAGRAQQLIGEGPQQNYDLGELVKELTRAAESVRALANYLSENPDALLKGRPK